ncbi:MAG: DUF58 domain-containing protein [Saprospiraceae bacterium]|nr:DUF58 domain-containing protein [Saprospiraceae bacterium]
MNVQDLLSRVKRIEIKTKSLTNQVFSGAWHSSFKGRGMSFSEVRDYAAGDDVRHIDWNVTARTGQAFVKVFEEERELTIMLLIDISDSTFFGSTEFLKSEWITELAAVLAFSASQNQDKVGLLLFSDKTELYIPPKKGKQHILRLIREMLVVQPGKKKSGLEAPLRYLNGIMNKKCVCFICSDFLYKIPESTLKILTKKHDIIGFQILDPLEIKWKQVGIMPVRDAESGQMFLLDTDDPKMADSLRNGQEQHNQAVKNAFLRSHADFMSLDMSTSYTKNLIQFFKRRGL